MFKSFKKLFIAYFLGFILVTAPGNLLADESEALANAAALALLITAGGFNVSDYYNEGFLKKGDKDVVSVTLQAGVTYHIFVGGCDSAKDIDVKIYDGFGNLIDEDISVDRTGYVSIIPYVTSVFYVEVKMYSTHNTDGAHYTVLYANQ